MPLSREESRPDLQPAGEGMEGSGGRTKPPSSDRGWAASSPPQPNLAPSPAPFHEALGEEKSAVPLSPSPLFFEPSCDKPLISTL